MTSLNATLSLNADDNCCRKLVKWLYSYRLLLSAILWIGFEIGLIGAGLSRHAECNDNYTGIMKRMLLVLSNAFMIPATLYCIHLGPMSMAMEIALYSVINVVSSLYHLCDDRSFISLCSRYCVIDEDILVKFDVALSFHMIVTLALFSTADSDFPSTLKGGLHILFLTANYFVAWYLDDDNMMLIIASIFAVIVLVMRVLYLQYLGKLEYYFKNYFDWKDAIAASVFAALGLTMKILGNEYRPEYWIYHSLWHVFVMTSIWFGSHIYDQSNSLIVDLATCRFSKCCAGQVDEPLTPIPSGYQPAADKKSV